MGSNVTDTGVVVVGDIKKKLALAFSSINSDF